MLYWPFPEKENRNLPGEGYQLIFPGRKRVKVIGIPGGLPKFEEWTSQKRFKGVLKYLLH